MAAVLGTNIASIYASKNLQGAQSSMATSVERLSSGLRINRAKDDAAGLAISNQLTQQINGANQGIKNLNDGVSLVQTADGALATVTEMAQRILTLATQASSGVLSDDQIDSIKLEATGLLSAIEGIQTRSSVNGTLLFEDTAISIQSSNVSGDTISITASALVDFSASSASTDAMYDLTLAVGSLATSANAQSLIDAASDYIIVIDTQRSELGSLQNQMDYAITNVTQLSADLSSARSRVVDTDYALETSVLTKGQILQQAATAMLAQANQMPNVILSLLK
jgi:flagellin